MIKSLCFNMPRGMGRGMGLAKLALGMGALRAANTAVRAAAWSSRPYSYYRPYGYYSGYDPYYYGSGYYGGYGYSYGSSRGAGWFIAAIFVAIAGACCLLIPGIAGIICCGVGIAAALGLTIGGIVAANRAPDTVVVKEQSNQKQVEGKSTEQAQSQEQTQSKGNCAEKPRVMAPIENQMGIIRPGKSFYIKTDKKMPQQLAQIKQTNQTNFATKYKNQDNKNAKQYVKFNKENINKCHQLANVLH